MSVPSYIKLSPQMDMATLINALNQNFNQVQSQDRRKTITDEDGQDRIVLGKQDDGTYAIRVSADGYDVDTATDDQLVMNSDWNMWKIVASGSTLGMTFSSTKRSSSITLNSSNIGYISDVVIPIRNLTVPAATIFNANTKPQVFVRDTAYKRLMSFTTNFYNDGTNKVDVYYSYFFWGKYLVFRTLLRWVAGSVSITPNAEAFEGGNLYWEIANATRVIPGGSGGGGSPSGQNVYYDSVTANPYTNDLVGYLPDNVTRSTVTTKTYSAVYSYTYQFFDNSFGYRFPNGSSSIPVIPAVDVDN